MKVNVTLFLISVLSYSCTEKDYLVTISTEFGDMKVILFDETPKHKSSFIEFAKAGKYDSTTFHRVMKDFMIQGGNVNDRPGVTERDNTLIDPEFHSHLIHTKGMLAGARTPNPQKRSGVQFYIVHGRKVPRVELEKLIEDSYYGKLVSLLNRMFQQGKHQDLLNQLVELQQNNDVEGVKNLCLSNANLVEAEFGPQVKISYTNEQFETYETLGGSPHLDGEYTVFGKVVEGLEVLGTIAAQPTGGGDKPLKDIYMTVSVEQVSKKKLSKIYGVEYSKYSK